MSKIKIFNYVKIGKGQLRRMLGDQCPNSKKEIPLYSQHCIHHCPYYDSEKQTCTNRGCNQHLFSFKYINENEKYKLYDYPEDKKFLYLSKNQMKLFLLLHSIPLETPTSIQDGQKKPVSTAALTNAVNIKNIADTIGCHVITIKSCMDKLKELDFIDFETYHEGYEYQFILPRYYEYFYPAQKGGAGYVTIKKEDLVYLLNIKDVNELRVELARLVCVEENEKTITNIYKFEDVSFALPQYIRYRSIYKEKSQHKKLFIVELPKQKGKILIKKIGDITKSQLRHITQCEKKIKESIAINFKNIETKTIASIVNLCIQYSVSTIISAISLVIANYTNIDTNTDDEKLKLIRFFCAKQYILALT